MDIPNDCNGRGDVYDVAFSHKDLLGLFAYLAEEGFSEQLLVLETLDAGIEIERRHVRMDDEVKGRGSRPGGGTLSAV